MRQGLIRWNPKFVRTLLCLGVLLFAGSRPLAAQGTIPSRTNHDDAIHQLNISVQDLVKRVSPAVVEVLVTGYGSPDEGDSDQSNVVGKERSLGSGVIVDPTGYIVTNYHVIKGAERVRVVLSPATTGEPQAKSLLKSRRRVLPARIVGFSRKVDLAVLKVEATGLPTLPFGRYDEVEKGQLVFAFGSPQGLVNSVTLGLVSSVLRQPDPDSPLVYIQTDAAINPGNSGGPLVSIDGDVLGINTFIYTKSGGNEGIGFAIPAAIARYAYLQIRRYGRMPRRTIGVGLQTITPELAGALSLGTQDGIIVSDVPPDSPAEKAGLQMGDIIVGIDSMPVDNLPLFVMSLYLLNSSDSANLQVLRGTKKLGVTVPIYEPRDDPDRLSDLGDPSKDLIPGLGILGVTITPEISALLGQLRVPSGVLITARVDSRLAVDSGLVEGDIVHSLNRMQVTSLEELRAAFAALHPGDPAAILVERDGRLFYVTFEID